MKELIVLLLSLCLSQSVWATDYVLSASTMSSSSTGTTSFTSNDQTIQITNNGDKKIDSWGDTELLKFSSNVQYTITGIPSGETVTAVKFEACPHDENKTVYVSEFNGTTYDSSTTPANFSSGTSTSTVSYTFSSLNVAGDITFTFKESQTCAKITVTTSKSALYFPKSDYYVDLADPDANNKLPVAIYPSGDGVTYSSNDTNVLTVFDNDLRVRNTGTVAVAAYLNSDNSVKATCKVHITAPEAAYDLTSNAFEIKSAGKLTQKTFALDGLTFTFGGDAEQPVGVENTDLGYGVECLDYNGFTFFDNNDAISQLMGSYIVIKTTEAGTLGVRGNFVNSDAAGWTNLYKISEENNDLITVRKNFSEGNNLQTVHLGKDSTFYLTTWHGTEYATFYLNALTFTPDDASYEDETTVFSGLKQIDANGDTCQIVVKKGQKITVKGYFYNNGNRVFKIDNVTLTDGTAVSYAGFQDGVASFIATADTTVTITNENNIYLYITSITLSKSDPILNFENGTEMTIPVSTTGVRNRVIDAPAGATVTYTSDSGVTVDESTGVITSATTAGKYTVTVTTGAIGYYNSATASYTLNVVDISFDETYPSIAYSAGTTYTQTVSNSELDVTYSIANSSNVTASIDESKGTVTIESLTDGSNAGVVEVKATSGDQSVSYYLTVIRTATDGSDLDWNFGSNANLASSSTDNWTTTYENLNNNNFTINAYNKALVGNNAFVVPATAGLQFVGPVQSFGYLNVTENGDTTVNRCVSFKHGNTLIIPKLKAGQYVKVWWSPYAGSASNDDSGSGARFYVENLSDLDSNPITSEFSVTGVSNVGKCRGQACFRVTSDGDVKFHITDNGWNNIIRIVVSTTYSTDLRLAIGKPGNSHSVCKENNNQALVTRGYMTTFNFDGTPGGTHSMRARTPQYRVGDYEGNVKCTPSTTEFVSNGDVTYSNLALNVNGYGDILVVEDINCDGYVLDRCAKYLAVGEITNKGYPYTWDFTEYNMQTTNSALSSEDSYGQWSENYEMTNRSTRTLEGLEGYDIDIPYFAKGSQLMTGTKVITEAEGLGINPKYVNDGEGTVSLDGKSLSFTSAETGGDSIYINVPSVDAGMYVYVKASAAPDSVSSNVSEVTAMTHLIKDSVKCYYVNTKGDVILGYKGDVQIRKIGVTNIFKTGFAQATSESRDRAIDYSQTGEFTTDTLRAYIGTAYNDGTDAGALTIKRINVVPDSTGLLLYKDSTDNGYTIPLFVPANNSQLEDTTGNLLKPHVGVGTVDGSTNDIYRYVFTNKFYYTGTDSTQYKYGDYGFYKVNSSGTLAANKAYLELKQSSTNAKGFQLVLLNWEDVTTGINSVVHDDEDELNNGTADGWYTLQGIKLSGEPTQEGIYIHKGKKVIFRRH